MMRPLCLLVVIGTGTEVGKTYVARQLLQQGRARGLRVAARKPAQSYAPGTGPTDAELLGAASGEAPQDVCPSHRWYEAAMAPPMAADALGRAPLSLAQLLAEIAWPAHTDLVLVETAGGLRSPITHDADNLDLVRRLAPDEALLVADAGLGTLHAVRSALPALQGLRTTVLLNRFDPHNDLHRRNHAWLAERDAVSIVTAPSQWWGRTAARLDRPAPG